LDDSSCRVVSLTQFPDSLVCSQVRYYRNASTFSQGTRLDISPRLRWKLDRFREQMSGLFGGTRKEDARPKLCPACGTLVGATATKCHQCGASMTFGMAAASRSLSRLLPTTSPATYGILTLSCLLYGASLLATIRTVGFQAPAGGGLSALFQLGAIDGSVLQKLGASLPLPYDLREPWRFVMAVFLHGSLIHIAFNMWVLMDFGPQVEEMYGSARYLFIYVATGVGGYVLSSLFGHFAIGGSGAILGICGVIIAVTAGSRSISHQMLRTQVMRLLIYIAFIAFMGFINLGGFLGQIDNLAHIGGFITGFLLGKIMVDRAPSSPEERMRANLLGWAAGLAVVASLGLVALGVVRAG
jgi:membrane associated rhomboid family serine protease